MGFAALLFVQVSALLPCEAAFALTVRECPHKDKFTLQITGSNFNRNDRYGILFKSNWKVIVEANVYVWNNTIAQYK